MNVERLISCLRSNTSHSEQGKVVSIARRKNEIILMFLTDSNDARAVLQITRACDAVYFYMEPHSRPILVFVELKGTNIKDAADQISSTINGVRALIRGTINPKFPQTTDIRAVVVRSGSTPQSQQEIQERFFKDTGVKLQLVREKADLRNFL